MSDESWLRKTLDDVKSKQSGKICQHTFVANKCPYCYQLELKATITTLQREVESLRGELSGLCAELGEERNLGALDFTDLQDAHAALKKAKEALELVGCRVDHPDDSKLPGCDICERIDEALAAIKECGVV